MATEQKHDKYKTYAQNKKAKGFKKIHRWIPECDEQRVDRYLARLTKEFEKAQA